MDKKDLNWQMEIDNQIFKFGIRDESISNSHKIECSVSLREDESLDPNIFLIMKLN